MCKEQRPLSTVRFLADALSLSPSANLPTPEANQPTNNDNDNDNALTPEEIDVFQDAYLQRLPLTGDTPSLPAQDTEEMRYRGIPPPSDEEIASAREERRDREFALWRQMLQAYRSRWLSDLALWYGEPEDDDEPEEYEFSDDDRPDPDHNLLSANDNDERHGNAANGLQSLENDSLPQGPEDTQDMRNELLAANTDGVQSPVTPDQLQELRESFVQSVGSEDEYEDYDDDVEFGDEQQDMVQMVGVYDARSAEQRDHALRSDSPELEEGEIRE